MQLESEHKFFMVTNSVSKWRMAKGVTKAHLARRVGVARSYVTKLEQGILQPSGEMMFRIAKYLGCTLEQVFQHDLPASQPAHFLPQVMPVSQTKTISRPPLAASGTTNNEDQD